MKTCNQCGEVKDLSLFKEGGKKPTCKSCDADRAREYRKINQSRVNESNRQRRDNPISRTYYTEKSRAWRDRLKAEGRYDAVQFVYLLNKYNLTLERYSEMLEAQNGRCPGCGTNKDLVIDHDHNCCPEDGRSCGKCVRGLLCNPCNTFAGRIEQNPQRHAAILNYLKEHSL